MRQPLTAAASKPSLQLGALLPALPHNQKCIAFIIYKLLFSTSIFWAACKTNPGGREHLREPGQDIFSQELQTGDANKTKQKTLYMQGTTLTSRPKDVSTVSYLEYLKLSGYCLPLMVCPGGEKTMSLGSDAMLSYAIA